MSRPTTPMCEANKLMVTTDVSGTVLEVDVREGQFGA